MEGGMKSVLCDLGRLLVDRVGEGLAQEADRTQKHSSPPRGGPQVGEGGIQHGQLLQHRCAHLQHRPALLGLDRVREREL